VTIAEVRREDDTLFDIILKAFRPSDSQPTNVVIRTLRSDVVSMPSRSIEGQEDWPWYFMKY
jgi:hypothetical protein